jgi:hypothetical protein
MHDCKGFARCATLGFVILVVALSAGCTDLMETDTFPNDHGGIKGVSSDLCDIYYENITIVAKSVEIESTGFGSRSIYAVAVKEDDTPREAATLKIYSSLEPNQTYHVEEVDRKGCGRSYHRFWITGAVNNA